MKDEDVLEEVKKRKNFLEVLKAFKILKSPSRYTISKFLEIDYAQTHRIMKRLEEMGVVVGKVRKSEKGGIRFRKVYELTDTGENILKITLANEIPRTASIYASVGLSDELRKELDKLRKRGNGEVPTEDR